MPTEEQAIAEANRHLSTEDLDNDICFIRYTEKVKMDDVREILAKINLKSDAYVVWFDRAS